MNAPLTSYQDLYANLIALALSSGGTIPPQRPVGLGPAVMITSPENRSTPGDRGALSAPHWGTVPKGVKPMRKTLFTLFAGLALATSAQTAAAQGQNCAPRDLVVKRLTEKYGESRQSIGMGQQGMVMETFASGETGSWTITVTTANGMTCLVASGQSYEILAEALPAMDTDA